MNTFLEKSKWIDDWFVVPTPGPQPEGTAAECREIVRLMRLRQEGSAGRRIAIALSPSLGVYLWSPRNVTDDPDDFVHIEDPDAWADAAERLLDAQLCVRCGHPECECDCDEFMNGL